jgi:hypothetical protein
VPVPELRRALPELQRLVGPWADVSAEARQTYRYALLRIEKATADVRLLPIPATLTGDAGRNLPISCTMPETQGQQPSIDDLTKEDRRDP